MIDFGFIDPEAKFEMMLEVVTATYLVDETRCRIAWNDVSSSDRKKMDNEDIYNFVAPFFVKDPSIPTQYAKSALTEYFAA